MGKRLTTSWIVLYQNTYMVGQCNVSMLSPLWNLISWRQPSFHSLPWSCCKTILRVQKQCWGPYQQLDTPATSSSVTGQTMSQFPALETQRFQPWDHISCNLAHNSQIYPFCLYFYHDQNFSHFVAMAALPLAPQHPACLPLFPHMWIKMRLLWEKASTVRPKGSGIGLPGGLKQTYCNTMF